MALRVLFVRKNSTQQCLRCKNNRSSMTFSTKTAIPEKSWRTTLEEFSQKNNIGLQDWYQVDIKTLDEPTSQLLKKEFKGSLYHAVSSLFPEKEWYPWKFQQRVPVGYWNSIDNQRKYFDWLGKELGIKKLDNWYKKLSNDTLIEHGGSGLLTLKSGSARSALMGAYPEHNWIPSKFKGERRGLWSSVEAQRDYFDWLGKQVGVTQLDDWYEKLSIDVINNNGGSRLLALKRPPVSLLIASYPEHNWMPWKFKILQPGLWSSDHVRQQYFDWLGKELGIQTLDGWYEKLSTSVMIENGGVGLLDRFKGSARAALMAAYPDHNWEPWKFNNTSGAWESPDTVKQFLSELSDKLSIQTLDDWYRVDRKQLDIFGATPLLAKYNGLCNILKEQYPHHPWDPKRFQHGGKKGQRWLAVTLKKMFPNEAILEDYMHPKAVFPSSNRPMQLDIFIPSKSLAFEYQGEHHYEEVGLFGPSKMHQQRDEEKRVLCAANNIKLIEVPYWWNRTQESLQEIIGTNLK